ncbi:MAG: hypothetical protein VZS44_03210 [Bacilli bacterium]|nr:hypothetical protein [Bacilli bacterium]
MVNIYESVKNIINGDNKVKLQKDNKSSHFVKSDVLGNLNHIEIDNLTKTLISWYKLKMPNRLFTNNNGKLEINKDDISYTNYENMTFGQLFRRNTSLLLLKCKYGNGSSFYSNDKLNMDIFTTSGFFGNKIDKLCKISIDRNDGKILDVDGDYLLPLNIKNNYTDYNIEELLELLKKDHIERLNYNSISNYVSRKKKDLSMRNKIIKKVCMDLIASSNDKIEYGYYRAVTFLNDIGNFLKIDFDKDYLNKLVADLEKKKVKNNSSVKGKKISLN